MRLNVQAAPERSDSASETLDFVSAAFASAVAFEVVLTRHPAALCRPAEVAYEVAVAAPAAASLSLTAPAA